MNVTSTPVTLEEEGSARGHVSTGKFMLLLLHNVASSQRKHQGTVLIVVPSLKVNQGSATDLHTNPTQETKIEQWRG